jgi:isopentenyl-diphosphate delta-isomerase
VTDVILVDERDTQLGVLDKVAAHTDPGALHRAVSVFVFDSRGALVVQRRAPGKYHFGGLWSNTACTHPMVGESDEAAGRRCLADEMGMNVAIRPLLTFRYWARDDVTDLVEHELDHVLIGRADGDPIPKPDEVTAWSRRDSAALLDAIGRDPSTYTPWLVIALPLVLDRLASVNARKESI